MTYLYIHQTSGYLSTANTSYLLYISLLIFHMLLQNLHLNWLVDAKNIDFLYSIITYFIWTIRLAMNFFFHASDRHLPKSKDYEWFASVRRAFLPLSTMGNFLYIIVEIRELFLVARIQTGQWLQLLCPKTINRTRPMKGKEYWAVAVIWVADRCWSISPDAAPWACPLVLAEFGTNTVEKHLASQWVGH